MRSVLGASRAAPGSTEREAPRTPASRGSHRRAGGARPAENRTPAQLLLYPAEKRRCSARPHVALLLIISIHRAPIMSKNNRRAAGHPLAERTKIAAWERLSGLQPRSRGAGAQGRGTSLPGADPAAPQPGWCPGLGLARPRGAGG